VDGYKLVGQNFVRDDDAVELRPISGFSGKVGWFVFACCTSSWLKGKNGVKLFKTIEDAAKAAEKNWPRRKGSR
jgi:hypothetical protein